MTRLLPAAALATVCLPALCAGPAHAHAVAGARVFPVTLTIDDPGVADEASLPTFSWQRQGTSGGPGPIYQYNIAWEYDKRITDNFALIYNQGYTVQSVENGKTQTGFEDVVITAKYQAFVNAPHELIVSLGVTAHPPCPM